MRLSKYFLNLLIVTALVLGIGNLAYAGPDEDAHANALLAELQLNSGAGVTARGYIMGTLLPTSGPLTSGPQYDELYGLLFDQYGNHTLAWNSPSQYVDELVHASTLLYDLRANGNAGITSLSVLFGYTLPTSGTLTGSQIDQLYSLMFDDLGNHTLAYTNSASFALVLTAAESLHNALATHRAEFAAVYNISVTNQNPVTNGAYRGKLFDIIGTGGYSEANFLADLTATNNLHTALSSSKLAFETIYGITVTNQVLTNGTYKSLLSQIVAPASDFDATDQSAYIADLDAVASLHNRIGAEGLKDEFETAYGISIIDQNPVNNPAYRQRLFDIINGSGYDQDTYINGLANDLAGKGQQLLTALQANSGEGITALNYVAGTILPVSGPCTTQAQFDELYRLVGIMVTNSSNPSKFSQDYIRAAIFMQDMRLNGNAGLNLINGVMGYGFPATGVLSGSQINVLFSILYDGSGNPTLAYTDPAAYLIPIQAVQDLHTALDGHRTAFEEAYGISTTGQTLPGNSMYRGYLFDITGTPGYSQTAYLTNLDVTYTLHNALNTYRSEFQTLYGTTTDMQLFSNSAYRVILSSIVAPAANFDLAAQTAFIQSMDAAASLHNRLTTDNARAQFFAAYGIAVIDQNPVTNATYRGILFNIVGTTGYNETTFVNNLIGNDPDTHANALLAELQLNSGAGVLARGNVLGTTLPLTGPITTTPQHDELYGMLYNGDGSYGLAWYNPQQYTQNMIHASSLLNELRANSGAGLAVLASTMGITLPDTGVLTGTDIDELFSLLYDGDGNQTQAYTSPTLFIQGLTNISNLHTAMVGHETQFNTIYGVATTDQNMVSNPVYRGMLYDITGTPGFDQADYVPALDAAASLHNRLTTDNARAQFFAAYGIAVIDQNPVTNATYRGILFNIVGTTGYNETTFVNNLIGNDPDTHANALLAELQLNSGAGVLARGNVLGTTLPVSGPLTTGPQYDELYSMLYNGDGSYGIAWYNPQQYTQNIIHASSLLNELRANSGAGLAVLSSTMGITLPASGILTDGADINELFGLLYDGSGNQTQAYTSPTLFIQGLTTINNLHTALIGHEAAFAAIYGVATTDQNMAANPVYRGLLYDITGTPGFDQADYVPALDAVASLHARLTTDNARSQFATAYGIAIGDQNPVTNATYRGILFNIVGTVGYDETAFVNGLVNNDPNAHANALLTQLQLNSGAGVLAKAYVLGTTLPVSGPLTTGPQYDELYSMLYNADGSYGLAWFNPGLYVQNILHASSLLSALRANSGAGLLVLEPVTGISLPQNGIITNSAQINWLFGLLYDQDNNQTLAYTDPTAYINALIVVNDLYNALAANRDDFATIYNIPETAQNMAGNPVFRGLLFDIAGAAGFDQAAYVTCLDRAASLHRRLIADGLQDEFATAYGIAIADQNPATNAVYRGLLFNIVGPTAYNENAFILNLSSNGDMHANALLVELQANNGAGIVARANLLGTILPLTGPCTTQAQLNELYSILFNQNGSHTLAWDDPYEYVRQFTHASRLLNALRADSGVGRWALYNVTGMDLPQTGTLTQAQISQLWGLMYFSNGSHTLAWDDPEGFSTIFFHASCLLDAFRANSMAGANALAAIKGITLPQTGALSGTQIEQLFGLMYDANGNTTLAYQNAANFVQLVIAVQNLHNALASYREDFAEIFNIAVADQNPLTNPVYMGLLFDIAGGPTYDQATFLANLNSLERFDAALAAYRSQFQTMYGIAAADQLLTNPAYRNILQAIIYPPQDFTLAKQTAYITCLSKAASLHLRIIAAGKQDEFAKIYNISISEQNPATNGVYLGQLFDIVGPAQYTEDQFIARSLDLVLNLHIQLEMRGLKDEFQVMYGVSIANQNYEKNASYRNLLAQLSAPDTYNQTEFCVSMGRAASLHTALMGNATYKNAFIATYWSSGNTMNPATNADYRANLLYWVRDNPDYDQQTFLTDMVNCYNLFNALAPYRSQFATLYGVSTNDQFLSSWPFKTLLSSIVWTPGYNQAAYVAALPLAASLHSTLAAYRAEFAAAYNIAESDQDPVTNGAYRGLLFNIVGTAGYTEAGFISDLTGIPALEDPLVQDEEQFQTISTSLGTVINTVNDGAANAAHTLSNLLNNFSAASVPPASSEMEEMSARKSLEAKLDSSLNTKDGVKYSPQMLGQPQSNAVNQGN